MSEPLVFPTIHMNGTSPESLLEDISKASRSLQASIEALAHCGPNGRDYYVQADKTAYVRAVAQYERWTEAVRGIVKELEAHRREHRGSSGSAGRTKAPSEGATAMKIENAAIKLGDRIWIGKRHANIMSAIYAELGDTYISQDAQGFVASDGQFYNRFQAGAIAFRAGQVAHRHEKLLSEDVMAGRTL